MVNKNVFTRCVQGPLFLFYERLPDHHVLYFTVISAKHLQCSHQSQKGFVAKYKSSNMNRSFQRTPSLQSTNARNVSFRIPLRWLTYIVNSVDKTKLSCNIPTDAAPQFL